MGAIICELCGSNDITKQDGLFVCQHCGTKYAPEDAKKLFVEGTVKVDNSERLSNLYKIARRAKDDNNSESAEKYYDLILMEDPMSWEATFYVVFFRAMQCRIAQIQSAANSITNCIDTVLSLISQNVASREDRIQAVKEICSQASYISSLLHNAAMDHYNGIDSQIKSKYHSEMVKNCYAALCICYRLGDCIYAIWPDDSEMTFLASETWKMGVVPHEIIMENMNKTAFEYHEPIIRKYVEKIQMFDSNYKVEVKAPSEGCYVATAVYGSYDCPQVWTLRRFRDYSLANTWYGRTFIRVYYATSPTLVKWFGQTAWIKELWKSWLDRMVMTLNEAGFEDTPYEDRHW